MTNPKQMNANYRKNERLLEKNPTPIDIGLSEDVKAYVDSQITEELPEYTTSDDGKVLGVTVDSSGETPVAELEWVTKSLDGFYLDSNSVCKYTGAGLAPGATFTPIINLGSASFDYIIFTNPTNMYCSTNSNNTIGSSLQIVVTNCGTTTIEDNTTVFNYYVYKRPKKDSINTIFFVGSVGRKCIRPQELPATLGTAGQILAVNSGATGVEWKNPAGMTPHTYSTWGELATDIRTQATGNVKSILWLPNNITPEFVYDVVDSALSCVLSINKITYDTDTMKIKYAKTPIATSSTDTTLTITYDVVSINTTTSAITHTTEQEVTYVNNARVYY